MDQLLFHPKIVHLPIALAMVMPLFAGAVLVAWWRKWLPAGSWFLVIGLQAVLVVSGFVAMNTGEADEDRVEEIVAHSHIHDHEEAAEAFVYGSLGVLAVMVVAAFLPRERLRLVVALVALIGTIVGFGMGYRTGEAGGRLVYEHGAAEAFTAPGAGAGH